jgi:hypothetical protein
MDKKIGVFFSTFRCVHAKQLCTPLVRSHMFPPFILSFITVDFVVLRGRTLRNVPACTFRQHKRTENDSSKKRLTL